MKTLNKIMNKLLQVGKFTTYTTEKDNQNIWCVYVCMHVCEHVCMCVCVCLCVCVCALVHVWVSVCTWKCVWGRACVNYVLFIAQFIIP